MMGEIDILTGTFSKSLASIGGWIAGPTKVIDWIRFNGRSMLFSAAIAPLRERDFQSNLLQFILNKLYPRYVLSRSESGVPMLTSRNATATP